MTDAQTQKYHRHNFTREQQQQSIPSLVEWASRQPREQLINSSGQRFFQMRELNTGPSQNSETGKIMYRTKRPIPGMGKPLATVQSHRDGPLLSATHTILSREDWQPGYEQRAQITAGRCLPPRLLFP